MLHSNSFQNALMIYYLLLNLVLYLLKFRGELPCLVHLLNGFKSRDFVSAHIPLSPARKPVVKDGARGNGAIRVPVNTSGRVGRPNIGRTLVPIQSEQDSGSPSRPQPPHELVVRLPAEGHDSEFQLLDEDGEDSASWPRESDRNTPVKPRSVAIVEVKHSCLKFCFFCFGRGRGAAKLSIIAR